MRNSKGWNVFARFGTRSRPPHPAVSDFAGPSLRTSIHQSTSRAKKVAKPLGTADYDAGLLRLVAILGALIAIIYFTWGRL